MSDVSTKHPEYLNSVSVWDLCRDAVTGNEAIKAGAEKYLPHFVPHDADRYKQYLQRAYYMNVTGRTLESLSGMVFRKPLSVTVPALMEDYISNIDGAGQSLEQIAKAAIQEILTTGRYGLMADYPAADTELDAETQATMELRPVISCYPAESVINWRTTVVNGQKKLVLVVLVEAQDARKTEFDHTLKLQYRVLRLDVETMQYSQQIYDASGQPVADPIIPLAAGGQPFDHIPFYFAGSSNNLLDVDKSPIYNMAILNIAHYQTTADHRENLHIHGQLTLGITTQLSFEEFQRANPSGVYVGARAGHFLGESGAFHSVTAPESSSLSKALSDLEEQMVALGARLVQPGGQPETATAARINASAEASALDTVVNNLGEALEACLEDMALFAGADPEAVELALNTDFWEAGMDASLVSAVIQAGDAGVIAKSDQLHMIRSGRIEIREGRTDEEIQEEIASGLLDI